jgi:Cu-Zn family superoxide dismutase
MRVTRRQRIWLATVISGTSVYPMLAQKAAAQHQHAQVVTPPAARQPEPSVLDALRERFDGLLARTNSGWGRYPGAKRRAEMFEEFLAWPRNPFRIEIPVTRTWTSGSGQLIGTITVGNSEIMVAGRKEVGLFIKPNLRGLAPGFYAFHVHENPACGPAIKDGEVVPGMAAGNHLLLSGTGAMSGTTFTSHLGDLPDLEVDADGAARKEIVVARLTLADVVNRSFIVHASQDDSSPRLACAPLK